MPSMPEVDHVSAAWPVGVSALSSSDAKLARHCGCCGSLPVHEAQALRGGLW